MFERKPILSRYNFQWYPYLKDASTACDRLNANLEGDDTHVMYVWPREYDNTGKRDFIVEKARYFWDKYRSMKSNNRTFYEVIRAGYPCRFYMDLEFCKVLNPDVIGEYHMITLRHYIKEMFLKKLGVNLELYRLPWRQNDDPLRGTVIELDSSNDVKFSRHLVVNLQSRCLFRNTEHVNEFATHLHHKLYRNDFRIIKLVAGHRCVSTLIDLSVYTNNRNFRIILSSKFHDRGVRPLHLYIAVPSMIVPEENLTYDIFRSTLIGCTGTGDWNLLGWPANPARNKRRHLILPHAGVPLRRQMDNVPRIAVPVQVPNPNPVRLRITANEQYPKIWSYFDNQILPTWPQPLDENLPPIVCVSSVYSVKYSRVNNNFIYVNDMGNRYCNNIHGQHARNNIFFRIEVSNFRFMQGCHDVACGRAFSPAIALPPEVLF